MHDTIKLQYLEKEIDVDELIAPLIKNLWHFEIFTWSCCQGDENEKAIICFNSENDFTKFMNMLVHNDSDINFVTMPRPKGCSYDDIGWNYNAIVKRNYASGRIIYTGVGVNVHFPHDDLKWVSAIFDEARNYNKRATTNLQKRSEKQSKDNLSHDDIVFNIRNKIVQKRLKIKEQYGI